MVMSHPHKPPGSFRAALEEFFEQRYGDHVPRFPKGMWVAGIVGSLAGMVLFGAVPEGYGLGLPCLLIYNAVHGLLTGRITWASSSWHPRSSSTRRNDPGMYGLAVMVYLLFGG